MTRPLYKTAIQQPADRPTNGHAGLWFDKFCDQWRRDAGSWTMKSDGDENPKLVWIRSVADGREIGARDQIEECRLRLIRMIHRRDGRAVVFTTASRFVSGLGRSHPVENGFAWHPTLGTPYLPGSSVKGLVRAWAKANTESGSDRETLTRLLGKVEKAGSVCFLDAVPVAPVKLEADVMTPHYAGWNEHDPPGDWRSPTPIPFLTTAQGTSFLFGLVPCRTADPADLDAVSTWLSEALKWAGGGAKTAVGYGRFRRDDKKTDDMWQRIEREDRRRREALERQDAMKTPEGRWRLELRELSEADILDRVRVNLEKTPLEDPRERRAFAQAVPADLIECWRKGKPRDQHTQVGKKKLKDRVRLIDSAVKLALGESEKGEG